MSLEDVHDLLLQAPVSQVNSVLADLRGLVSSGGSSSRLGRDFEESLPGALRQLHEDQGKVVRLPGLEAGSILTKEARSHDKDAEYRDEAQSKVFSYDHAADKVASSETYRAASSSDNELKTELERQLGAYLRDHYPDLDPQRTNEGACGSVLSLPTTRIQRRGGRQEAKGKTNVEQGAANEEEVEQTPQETAMAEKATEDDDEEQKAMGEKAVRVDDHEEDEDEDDESELVETSADADASSPPSHIITIVSGKSNAKNFWSGRLLSTYHCRADVIEAHTKLQIHYYENGNVQLNAEVPAIIPLTANAAQASSSPAAQAKAIISAIGKHEQHLQETQLERDVYEGLNERAFKGLRRQLPVTRQKVDWDKVTNYRLGQDLADHNEGAAA